MNIVGAIGPMRSIFNVSSAFYNVLSKPIETGYQSSGDFIKIYGGFAEGMGGLYETLSEEGYNAKKKIFKVGSAAINSF